MADRELDCKNLRCPMPIVEISREIKKMAVGETLAVEATDLAFKADIEAWTRKMGHEIVDFAEEPVQRVIIKKLK